MFKQFAAFSKDVIFNSYRSPCTGVRIGQSINVHTLCYSSAVNATGWSEEQNCRSAYFAGSSGIFLCYRLFDGFIAINVTLFARRVEAKPSHCSCLKPIFTIIHSKTVTPIHFADQRRWKFPQNDDTIQLILYIFNQH